MHLIFSRVHPSNWWREHSHCYSCQMWLIASAAQDEAVGQDKKAGATLLFYHKAWKRPPIKRFLKTAIPCASSVSATSKHCFQQSSGSCRTLPAAAAAAASQSTYQTTSPSQRWPQWTCGLIFLSFPLLPLCHLFYSGYFLTHLKFLLETWSPGAPYTIWEESCL